MIGSCLLHPLPSLLQVSSIKHHFIFYPNLLRNGSELERYSLMTLKEIHALCDKLDLLLSTSTSHASVFSGSCSVPGLPEFTIGLDQPFADLKSMLLNDTTRLLLVLGHGGLGKSTFVKKLGHDAEIQRVFGENILYVTVSTDSSLKSIAKTLFQHYDINSFDFRSEEEAKNQIENLVRQKGSDKMFLLILDDVWPQSESVIQNLRFQIPGYKILVTSRSLPFSGFDCTYKLEELNAEDAKTLFCHWAFPNSVNLGHNVPIDIVNKVVKFCKGIPLALITVGSSLRDKPEVRWKATLNKWSGGLLFAEPHKQLLNCLQTSIDALDELPKNCFLDLGLFPKGYLIFCSALMDVWVELYELDEDGMDAIDNLHELESRNLIDLVPTRKTDKETESLCSRYHVEQHDVLRELSVHLSGQGLEAKRERLIIEIGSNTFSRWWTPYPVNARVLSISTDEGFGSSWNDLNAPNVVVLILNVKSENYSLPGFIKRMSHLKGLIITGYGDYPTQLHNLQVLASLSELRRIRFEHVSVSSSIHAIFTLNTLKKLTFVMCKIGNALNGVNTKYPFMLENLKHLEFNSCYDLKELPARLCSCVSLQRLLVINCQELGSLPEELGNLQDICR